MFGDPAAEQVVGVRDRVGPAVVGEDGDGRSRQIADGHAPSVVGELGVDGDRHIGDNLLEILDGRRVQRTGRSRRWDYRCGPARRRARGRPSRGMRRSLPRGPAPGTRR